MPLFYQGHKRKASPERMCFSESPKVKSSARSSALGYEVGLIFRKNLTPDDPSKYTVKRLISPTDEKFDLDAAALEAAMLDTVAAWEAKTADMRSVTRPESPSGPALRKVRSPEKGLLLLYMLDPIEAKLPYGIPVVGFAISFPGDKLNPTEGVEYRANLVYIGKEISDEE